MGWEASARTERLCVLGRGGGWGRGWVPVGPVWAPRCFYTDRSRADASVVVPYCCLFLMSVFILWFSYYVSDMFCGF